ncbi:hypothetical protein M0R72_14035 [Candidatus Pacearchaeota archaeon]|jgi:hypothetical protein|nr:hypothetical protein [Candidatus Pacearchaeota archaeon]
MIKISTKKFDPNALPEGVWATFAEGVKLKIRKLTSDALRELRRPHVQYVMELNPTSRRMEQVEKLDSEKFDEALAAYMLEAFDGIGDDDGTPLPDTMDSRRAILNIPQLKEFIWAVAQSLDVAQEERNREAAKN